MRVVISLRPKTTGESWSPKTRNHEALLRKRRKIIIRIIKPMSPVLCPERSDDHYHCSDEHHDSNEFCGIVEIKLEAITIFDSIGELLEGVLFFFHFWIENLSQVAHSLCGGSMIVGRRVMSIVSM